MSPQLPGLRRVLPVVFAVGMGGAAIAGVHRLLTRERQKLEQERERLMANYQEPGPVVVAKKDIPEGMVLSADHLAMREVPEKFIQPYATAHSDDVVGQVTLAPIAEGEQVLRNKLRKPSEVPIGVTLSGVTPEGKRAVTIAIDDMTGVGGFVRPGDSVDILWTIALPQGGQEAQPVTLTLFQNVPVLAIGGEMLGKGTDEAKAGQHESSEKESRSATIALSPQDTSFLLFAREHGRIQLSLRPRSESGQAKVAPASMGTLMEQVLGVPPQPPPAPPREVEVYKGLKRNVVVLDGQK